MQEYSDIDWYYFNCQPTDHFNFTRSSYTPIPNLSIMNTNTRLNHYLRSLCLDAIDEATNFIHTYGLYNKALNYLSNKTTTCILLIAVLELRFVETVKRLGLVATYESLLRLNNILAHGMCRCLCGYFSIQIVSMLTYYGWIEVQRDDGYVSLMKVDRWKLVYIRYRYDGRVGCGLVWVRKNREEGNIITYKTGVNHQGYEKHSAIGRCDLTVVEGVKVGFRGYDYYPVEECRYFIKRHHFR